jgi:hypothetical protein
MDKDRREMGRRERERKERNRDRWRTETSNDGRRKGNNYVERKKCRGVAGDVIPTSSTVDKDYLDIAVVLSWAFLNRYRAGRERQGGELPSKVIGR